MKELPEDIQAKIIAYIDGDLPADEAAALEVYLANTDAGLSEMVVGMMADRHSLSVLPRAKAPHDLASRVMDQLERASLLHNVEGDIDRPHRRWWQSKGAIAAGLALVLGGFTYFVVHSIYRPPGPLNGNTPVAQAPAVETKKTNTIDAILGGGGATTELAAGPSVVVPFEKGNVEEGAAFKDTFKKIGPVPSGVGAGAPTDESAANPDLDANAIASVPTAEALQFAAKTSTEVTQQGAPAALVFDTRESVDDKIARDSAVLKNGPDAAKANGYIEAPSAQVALSSVSAAPAASVEGPPVVVYCRARDAEDVRRLEERLSTYMADNTGVNEVRVGKSVGGGAGGNAGGGGFGGTTLNIGGNVGQARGTTLANGGTIGTTTIGGIGSALNTKPPGDYTLANSGRDGQTSSAINSASVNTTNTVSTGAIAVPGANTLDIANNTDTVRAAETRTGVQPAPTVTGNLSIGGDNYVGPGGATGAIGNNNDGGITNNANNNVAARGGYQPQAGQPLAGQQDGNFNNYDQQYSRNANANSRYRQYQPAGGYAQKNYRAEQAQRAAEVFNGAANAPYRVFLRPDQLDQVASEFRVLSVTRGRVQYFIPAEVAGSATGTRRAAEPPRSSAHGPTGPDAGFKAKAEEVRGVVERATGREKSPDTRDTTGTIARLLTQAAPGASPAPAPASAPAVIAKPAAADGVADQVIGSIGKHVSGKLASAPAPATQAVAAAASGSRPALVARAKEAPAGPSPVWGDANPAGNKAAKGVDKADVADRTERESLAERQHLIEVIIAMEPPANPGRAGAAVPASAAPTKTAADKTDVEADKATHQMSH